MPIIDGIYHSHPINSLKNLWYRLRAYSQPGKQVPLSSYFLTTFFRNYLVRADQGTDSHLVGRCIDALVVKELVAGATSSSDPYTRHYKLRCISNVLETDSDDVKIFLECPGAVELAILISLTLKAIDTLFSDTPSGMLDMVQQSSDILIRTLPDELNVELMGFTDGQCEVILLSCLRDR